MLKWLLLLNLLIVPTVYAEEEEDTLAPEPTAAVVEDKTATVSENILPDCNNKELLKRVNTLIDEYDASNPINSLIERRQRQLKRRFLSEYVEEEVAGFTSKKNQNVANKLLMTKINFGLDDSEIKLCKSQAKDVNFDPVYVMIYPDKNENTINVNVLGYQKSPTEELSSVL